MTDRPDLDALTGAWALDALDDDERVALEAQLLVSDHLRTEATELADTAVLLGLAVPAEQPPAALKSTIMAAIADLPQQAPAPTADAVAPTPVVAEPAPVIDLAAAHGRHSSRAETKAAARWYRRPAAVLLAGAAALAVIAGGVFGVRTILPGLQEQAAYDRIVAAADTQSASVDLDGGAVATLHWSNELAGAALEVDGLDAPPSGSVYELWFIDAEGTATPAGTFVPTDGDHTVVLAGSLDRGDTVGVTVEPDGGSSSPTTDPIIVIATA